MLVKPIRKQNWKLAAGIITFVMVAAALTLSSSASALGSSSASYNLSVSNLDVTGGESTSSGFASDQMFDFFATGQSTSANYIIKAGYLYFKPPNAPTIGTPEPLSTSSIRWNFTDKAADEEGFLLEDEDETVTLVEDGVNVNSLTETGLSENQQYTRRVLAFNVFGNSLPSEYASTCTFAGLRALSGSPGSSYMDLSLGAFPRSSIGSSGYSFARIPSGDLGTTDVSGWQSGNNAWRSSGLRPNTQYTWTGQVRNICGGESNTTSLSACTAANVPGIPVASYSENNGTYVATVSFSANGNPAGTEYAVLANGNYLAPTWSTSLSRQHVVNPDTTYVYRVIARNCDGVETAMSLPGALYFKLTAEEEETGIIEIIETIPDFIASILESITEFLQKFREDPLTQLVNELGVVPALAALAAANLLAAAGLVNLASVLSSLWQAFTEPFLLLAGRRRRMWGVVYNSLAKVPADLALVRLLDTETGKLISTRVTDRKGRFTFLVKPGKFRITVTKDGFTFPSKKVVGRTHDVGYDDLYFGEEIEIASEKAVITVSIPVDPVAAAAAVETDQGALWRYWRRKISFVIALLGPILAVVCVWISPNIYTYSFLVLHSIIFAFFARVTFGKKGKPWGIVYDAKTNNPIGLAVVRIFSKKYGDLLETQVTDNKGRFGFLVGPETYRVTSDKPAYEFPSGVDKGYQKYRGEDFTVHRDGLVKFDIPMDPGGDQTSVKPPQPNPEQESSRQVEEKKGLDLGELGGPDS